MTSRRTAAKRSNWGQTDFDALADLMADIVAILPSEESAELILELAIWHCISHAAYRNGGMTFDSLKFMQAVRERLDAGNSDELFDGAFKNIKGE